MTTKTREQMLAEVDAKTAETKRKLLLELDTLEALGDLGEYEPPSISVHNLYGTIGSITFGLTKSYNKGLSPSPALLRSLLAAHPPVPMVQYRSGTLSYRPAASLTDKEREEGETRAVHPVYFRAGLNWYHQVLTAEWFGPVGGALWWFHVGFPLHGRKLGSPATSCERYPDGTISRTTVWSWNSGIPNTRVTPYAKGSPATFGDVVIWWDAGVDLDIPSLVEAK